MNRLEATVRKKTHPAPFGPRDAGIPMDLDEFEDSEFEEGYRYELIHGVLVVTPPPLEEERDANEELGHWLRQYRDFHPEGKALNLTLSEHNIRTVGQNRRPDRVLWVGLGRRPRTRGRPVSARDVPAIIVEFPAARPADQRRDYQEKAREYRAIGVHEYWIIDRFRRAMTVHTRKGGKWRKRIVGEGETYSTPKLPGFELPLRKLLRVMDAYRSDPAD
jgi:Uma2 family endonuclease